MKHYSFVLFMISCCSLYAQEIDKKTWESRKIIVGPYLNMNMSKFNSNVGEFGTNSSYKSQFRGSFSGGLQAKIKMVNSLWLTTGLAMSSRGGSYKAPASGVVSIGGNGADKAYLFKNYRLSYIEIPLIVSLKSKNSGFNVGAGLSYGLLMSSSLRFNEYSGTSPSVDESWQVEEFDHAQSAVSNFVFEFGAGYKIKGESLGFWQIRFNQSLSDVYKDELDNGKSLKTRMMTLSIIMGVYIKG
jgi:hypothetical protein